MGGFRSQTDTIDDPALSAEFRQAAQLGRDGAGKEKDGSPHVAAAAVLKRRIAQADPVGRCEIADGDRPVLLQGHQEGVPVLGRFAVREGHALDVVALPHERLERRLLLLRDRCRGASERSNGKRNQYLHELPPSSDRVPPDATSGHWIIVGDR